MIPETASSICLCASAAIGALIAGGVAGGGERRLLRAALVGVGCALGVLLAKGVCAKTTIWTWYTTTAIAESVAFSLLGSCIFHKSNKKRTKRKRKVKRKI